MILKLANRIEFVVLHWKKQIPLNYLLFQISLEIYNQLSNSVHAVENLQQGLCIELHLSVRME